MKKLCVSACLAFAACIAIVALGDRAHFSCTFRLGQMRTLDLCLRSGGVRALDVQLLDPPEMLVLSPDGDVRLTFVSERQKQPFRGFRWAGTAQEEKWGALVQSTEYDLPLAYFISFFAGIAIVAGAGGFGGRQLRLALAETVAIGPGWACNPGWARWKRRVASVAWVLLAASAAETVIAARSGQQSACFAAARSVLGLSPESGQNVLAHFHRPTQRQVVLYVSGSDFVASLQSPAPAAVLGTDSELPLLKYSRGSFPRNATRTLGWSSPVAPMALAIEPAEVELSDPPPHWEFHRVAVHHLVPLTVICTLLGMLFFRGPWRRADRRIRGECIACGYDLQGTESDRCPECGVPIPAGQKATRADAPAS